jgi:hypothetical protein
MNSRKIRKSSSISAETDAFLFPPKMEEGLVLAGNFWKVEFEPSSWRETFEELNSNPRLRLSVSNTDENKWNWHELKRSLKLHVIPPTTHNSQHTDYDTNPTTRPPRPLILETTSKEEMNYRSYRQSHQYQRDRQARLHKSGPIRTTRIPTNKNNNPSNTIWNGKRTIPHTTTTLRTTCSLKQHLRQPRRYQTNTNTPTDAIITNDDNTSQS